MVRAAHLQRPEVPRSRGLPGLARARGAAGGPPARLGPTGRSTLRPVTRCARRDAGKVRFGQVFLAAPDVDRDLFLDLARLYPEHAERPTPYTSGTDRPVHLSPRLHASPHAGYFLPY